MIRKGLVTLVLGVLFVFISCPLAWAQQAILNLNATQHGTELEAVVNLTNSGNAVAAQFDIVYDQAFSWDNQGSDHTTCYLSFAPSSRW
jgi:hypothetical protein